MKKSSLIFYLSSPITLLLTCIVVLIISILYFPNDWYRITVSMFYGFNKTKELYYYILVIPTFISMLVFAKFVYSFKNELTKKHVIATTLIILFTFLYTYFNVIEYLLLHYIFAVSAFISLLYFQYIFTSFVKAKGKVFLDVTILIIVLQLLTILFSYLLFWELVLPIELLIILFFSIWLILLIYMTYKEKID